MASIEIVFTNESIVLTDAQVRMVIPALQKQVTRDFAPVWGVDADLSFIAKPKPIPPQSWLIGVFDIPTKPELLVTMISPTMGFRWERSLRKLTPNISARGHGRPARDTGTRRL